MPKDNVTIDFHTKTYVKIPRVLTIGRIIVEWQNTSDYLYFHLFDRWMGMKRLKTRRARRYGE